MARLQYKAILIQISKYNQNMNILSLIVFKSIHNESMIRSNLNVKVRGCNERLGVESALKRLYT